MVSTTLLAAASEIGDASSISWMVLVIGGSTLLSFLLSAMQFVRTVGGKGGERQVEPTQIAAMNSKLEDITKLLGSVNREMGEIARDAKNAIDSVAKLAEKQSDQISRAHQRIDRVAETVANHGGRLDLLEKKVQS